MQIDGYIITVNDKSYAREKLNGFQGFLMNRPTNTLSNGSIFNKDEAKT